MATHRLLLVAAVLIGLPGAGTALHLGLLAFVSVFYRGPRPPTVVPPVRTLVLVLAHNEERVLGRTLAGLFADWPPDDQVLVVADRCTDSRADIARRAGALVLERRLGEEPGRAAAPQDGVRHALGDALVLTSVWLIVPAFMRHLWAEDWNRLAVRSLAVVCGGLLLFASGLYRSAVRASSAI